MHWDPLFGAPRLALHMGSKVYIYKYVIMTTFVIVWLIRDICNLVNPGQIQFRVSAARVIVGR